MTMTKQPARTPSRVPTFATAEEAGAFWDTHSPEEFPEEFAEASVQFERPLIKRGLTVKLSEETIGQLRTLAGAQGIGPSTLARMWILERLQEQGRRSKATSGSSS
ncbi:MAG: BrnA antitoxin family protein [Chloroflexi bacterium]|nr:BrnA antitoxin family protein [Chloroflexota bacterium]